MILGKNIKWGLIGREIKKIVTGKYLRGTKDLWYKNYKNNFY